MSAHYYGALLSLIVICQQGSCAPVDNFQKLNVQVAAHLPKVGEGPKVVPIALTQGQFIESTQEIAAKHHADYRTGSSLIKDPPVVAASINKPTEVLRANSDPKSDRIHEAVDLPGSRRKSVSERVSESDVKHESPIVSIEAQGRPLNNIAMSKELKDRMDLEANNKIAAHKNTLQTQQAGLQNRLEKHEKARAAAEVAGNLPEMIRESQSRSQAKKKLKDLRNGIEKAEECICRPDPNNKHQHNKNCLATHMNDAKCPEVAIASADVPGNKGASQIAFAVDSKTGKTQPVAPCSSCNISPCAKKSGCKQIQQNTGATSIHKEAEAHLEQKKQADESKLCRRGGSSKSACKKRKA